MARLRAILFCLNHPQRYLYRYFDMAQIRTEPYNVTYGGGYVHKRTKSKAYDVY
jgi:hypothetical protein